MAKNKGVQIQQAFLEPARRHLRDLVVVEHQRLQLPELCEGRGRDTPHMIMRGIEDLEVSQRPHSVQSLSSQLVASGGEISDLHVAKQSTTRNNTSTQSAVAQYLLKLGGLPPNVK